MGDGQAHTRAGRERRASFILRWLAVSALAEAMGWLLFSSQRGSHLAISGDLLGWDAAIAVLSGFFIATAQVVVLTTCGVAEERAATRHWISMTLVWALIWPAWLVASPAVATSSVLAPTLLWRTLPWLIFGVLSAPRMFATVRVVPETPPSGGSSPRPLADREDIAVAAGEISGAATARRAAVAAAEEAEAA